MAVTLMIQNITNDISLYPVGKSEVPSNVSYSKFYQLKLRQLLTQTRYRKEQEVRIARQKQLKNFANDHRISEQRLHREYMNHIRERSKMQTQENLTNRTDEQKRRSESVLSNSNRTVPLSIITRNISSVMESRPKTVLKTKQTSIPPSKQQRIISAPISSKENLSKVKIIPRIKVESGDDHLSKANMHSFTQVSSSSSSQNQKNRTQEHARQSVLDTVMLHLNSHVPPKVSIWPIYEEIDEKFSSSVAPTVYQGFERIAA